MEQILITSVPIQYSSHRCLHVVFNLKYINRLHTVALSKATNAPQILNICFSSNFIHFIILCYCFCMESVKQIHTTQWSPAALLPPLHDIFAFVSFRPVHVSLSFISSILLFRVPNKRTLVSVLSKPWQRLNVC